MAVDPKVRSAGLHLGTAGAASVATVMWMSSHSVDLYAMVDQLNDVIKAVATLVASVGTFVGGAVAIWKSTSKGIAEDVAIVAQDKASPLKGLVTEDTAEGRALARSVDGPVVSAGDPAVRELVRPTNAVRTQG